MEKLEAAGFTPAEVTSLAQSGQLAEFRGVLRGTHEIRVIEHVIDLSVPCALPFNGAERVSPAKSGIVRLERRGDDLYLDGRKVNLFLSEAQKAGSQVGYDLRKEVEARGGNASAKVLDYLVEHPNLWPEHWKKDDQGRTVYVLFWDDIFRGPSVGRLCVRYGCWRGGRVVSDYGWLGGDWRGSGPAASLAN